MDEAQLSGPWMHVRGVPGVDGVHLEVEVRDGRAVVVGLYVHGAEITPTVLHQVPLARLAARLNTGLDRLGDPNELTYLQGAMTGIESARAANLMRLRDRGLDEDFFAELARIYLYATTQTRAPAKLIADEIGVPVKTVHRWVREARLAGALPPARKGAAG